MGPSSSPGRQVRAWSQFDRKTNPQRGRGEIIEKLKNADEDNFAGEYSGTAVGGDIVGAAAGRLIRLSVKRVV